MPTKETGRATVPYIAASEGSKALNFFLRCQIREHVNYFILNACVKMAEMVICENILTISGYRNHTLTVTRF